MFQFNGCENTDENRIGPSREIYIIPKVDTQAWQFLQENPTADGRGTIICILDTGVDPGAPGLKITTEGKVKVIERWDCTGAGDVNTSTKVKGNICEKTGQITITGATGRELVVPKCWSSPNNEYRVGCKPLYDLYPIELRNKIIDKREKYIRKPQYHHDLGIVKRELDEFLEGPCTAEDAELYELEKENKKTSVELVQILIDGLEDCGPMVECVMFHSKTTEDWKICLSVEKDLSKGIVLQPYSKSYDYGNIYPGDNFNVSVNVWNDGNLLEIVGMSADHGTHVAGIAAGYFPENPGLSGVAPGAQIVSITIGDNRMDANDSSISLIRSMSRLMKQPQIHVVNMSFGDHAAFTPSGHLFQMMKEVIDSHNITWCCSGGNVGPALSTVKTPCNLSEDITIGVGALLTPEMYEVLYSVPEIGPMVQYKWTSCGPGRNGDMGVNICAPGGATASMPNYSEQGVGLKNGTSMSTPNAAGCIALMLSLAMEREVFWTPYAIKRCLENSATPTIPYIPFGQGFGLIQILDAYNILEGMQLVDKLVRYDTSVQGGSPGYPLKGIYLRDPPPTYPENFNVYITPTFFQKNKLDPNILINFRQLFTLYTETPVPWIEFPEFLDMYNTEENTKFIRLKINPCNLPGPGVHYVRIDGGPQEDPSKSSRHFSIHVTVIIPMEVNIWPGYPGVDFGSNVLYSNEDIHRYFVYPPSGTTFGVIHITNALTESVCPTAITPTVSLSVDVTVLEFGERVCLGNGEMLTLNGNEASKFYFPLQAEKVTEIAIYRNVLNIGAEIPISAYIEFHGITIQDSRISVASAEYHRKLIIQSKLGIEKVLPYGELSHQVQLLRPTFSPIQLVPGPREFLPQGKVLNQLNAEYLFHIESPTSIRLNCPILPDCSYESDFANLWQIFDRNKRYLAGGSNNEKKIEIEIKHKGTYTLLFQLIHEDGEVLCRLTKPDASHCLSCMPQVSGNEVNPPLGILLELNLEDNINVPAYLSLQKLTIKEDELNSAENVNSRSPLLCYLDVSLSNVDMNNLPGGKHTAFFTGKLFLSGDNCSSGTEYAFVPLQITMPNSPLPIHSSQSPEELCTIDSLVQTHMTHTTESLNELEGKLDTLTEQFENTKSLSSSEQIFTNGKEIIELCDEILNGIDILGVQTFFGASTCPKNSDGMNDLRETIIKTLISKGNVLCKLLIDGSSCEFSEADLDIIYKTTLLHTRRSETKVRKFMIEYFMIKKLYAIAAKLLWNMRKADLDEWTSEYHDKFTLCLYNLKLLGFVALLNDMKPVLFPPNFRPF